MSADNIIFFIVLSDILSPLFSNDKKQQLPYPTKTRTN